MKSWHVAIFLLSFILIIANAECIKIGPRLYSVIQGDTEHLPLSTNREVSNVNFVNVWITFNSKCDNDIQFQDLNIRQQRNRMRQKITTTDLDIPVCQNFIDQTLNGLKLLSPLINLRRVSKWLNGISVNVPLTIVNQLSTTLEHIPYISEIEIVSRFKRQTNELENTQSHIEDINNEVHLNVDKKSTHSLDYGPSWSQLNRIGIPTLHDQGLDGTGVTILVLDSGFNRNHEALVGLSVLDAYDFVHNDENVNDEPGDLAGESSHGTGTWSNIGGACPGQLYGGSYKADFLLGKTEDSGSESSVEEDNFVAAMEWGEARGAQILSASLGYDEWYTWKDLNGNSTITSRASKAAVSNGMLLIIANGNSGVRGLGTPADAYNVISVGALDNANPTKKASFSSIGPTSDYRIKPEVSAPGVSVRIARYDNIHGYSNSHGTSFATPLTAGAAGLIWQAHPDWTNLQVREAIIKTAMQLPSSGVNVWPNIYLGWGIVNATTANSYTFIPGSLPSRPGGAGSGGSATCQHGSWNTTTQRCDCHEGWYNMNCDIQRGTCRQYCSGLCTNNGCICKTSTVVQCTADAAYLNPAWNCPSSEYNDNEKCNCNCGRYDPDCDARSDGTYLPVIGCGNSNRCYKTQDGAGSCTLAQPETTPPKNPPVPQDNSPTDGHEPPKPKKSISKIVLSVLWSIFCFIVR